MPNFTPGPWTLEPTDPSDKEIFISAEGDGWARLQATVSQDDCDTETAQANAHLIAAAPAMYDALHRAVTEMEFWSKGHSDAEIAIARAALAQAEGNL